ncbi:erg2 C-8 sterol isomerase [Neohortaea acidophila]|uniref:C-8 sterol isomerase n=1 Tax=Neohortaea acidophila TaxID=245834 RepID=A0A6A6Q6P4_9PEZI|nr:erg2 C-8 sterol isomerase [Neohortaea acidophila]KAF2487952.1 erg2 C-8 sterol isomerase [Neohortaea acidophila]
MRRGATVYFSSAIALVLALLLALHQALEHNAFAPFYIFDPDHVQATCLTSVQQNGNNTQALVAGVVDTLAADEKLRPYLNLRDEWILNNAGGAMGAVRIVHASLTEYMIVFGTALGTNGHTGRLTADDYFHILQGTQLAFSAGSYEAEVYPAGSVHYLPRGQAQQMSMPGLCFAIGYARGWIPGLFPLGYADGVFSTVDYVSLWDMTKITFREVVGNLLKGKI